MKHTGEFAALLTAIFWTITALAFEASSKRVGSIVVNLFRLIIGFVFLSIFTWMYRGMLFPLDAPLKTWLLLILSGLIGFVIGDLCLFQAFVVIGARISMLLMALAPPMTAFIGWITLGEQLSNKSWLAMILTIAGIALVVLKREDHHLESGTVKKMKFSYPVWGILLGLGGAVGQSGGLVLSKYAMKGYSAFASAQIRVIAGIAGFMVLFTLFGYWKNAYRSLSNTKAMFQLSLGAFFWTLSRGFVFTAFRSTDIDRDCFHHHGTCAGPYHSCIGIAIQGKGESKRDYWRCACSKWCSFIFHLRGPCIRLQTHAFADII